MEKEDWIQSIKETLEEYGFLGNSTVQKVEVPTSSSNDSNDSNNKERWVEEHIYIISPN